MARRRKKKEKDARWKASKFTGKELWFRTGTKKDDDDDAIDEAARALGPRVPYEVLIQGLDIPSCAVALPPVRRMKMDFQLPRMN